MELRNLLRSETLLTPFQSGASVRCFPHVAISLTTVDNCYDGSLLFFEWYDNYQIKTCPQSSKIMMTFDPEQWSQLRPVRRING